MEAVIFDMDGVLLDTERVMHKAWARAAREMNFEYAEESGRLAMGMNSEGVRQLFSKKYPDLDYEGFSERYHRYTAKELEENGVPIKEGVIKILKFLRKSGYKTAVATSTSSFHAKPQLEETGILPYVDAIITGDAVENGKPHPEIYLKAAEAIGAVPEAAYAAEDSPNGIKSAYLAGMKAIFIRDMAELPDEYERMAYRKFESMKEFQEMLEKAKK